MSPGQDGRLLAKMPQGIASHILVFGQIGLLKIRATAHQQRFETIFSAGPVKLRGAAQRRSKSCSSMALADRENARR